MRWRRGWVGASHLSAYEDVLVVHTCVHTTARDRTPLSGHQAVVDVIYHMMAAQNTSARTRACLLRTCSKSSWTTCERARIHASGYDQTGLRRAFYAAQMNRSSMSAHIAYSHSAWGQGFLCAKRAKSGQPQIQHSREKYHRSGFTSKDHRLI